MKILRKICSVVLCAAVAVFMVCSLAEGKEKAGALSAEDFVPADTVAVSDIIEGLTARSAVVTEMTTGRVLFEKEPQEQCECGHYAKLMVLLLTAEKIDSGELSMSDTSVVSEYANSQQGSQIWLDKGEKISVEELIKSVSAGNANDGCAALAEKVAGSADKAVELMNSRAKMLGMALFTLIVLAWERAMLQQQRTRLCFVRNLQNTKISLLTLPAGLTL